MSWGTHKYMLIERINEIESAAKAEMWQSALALSLTIPDICGQIEFSDLRKNNHRDVGKQYEAWFNKYLAKYYTELNTLNSNEATVQIPPYFTGKMCYKLRCSFLHTGSDSIDNNNIKPCRFQLCIHSCGSSSFRTGGLVDYVRIDIRQLCLLICKSGREFYESWNKPEDFEDKDCTLLDIAEWYECYSENNNCN